MKVAVLCLSSCVFLTVASCETKTEVALRVLPNRSQFFLYESVSLVCEQHGNSSEWRVKKNTSRSINQECSNCCDKGKKSHCHIDDLYPLDTGVYWCESAAGERSDAVNITVTGGPVVLESPALPVTEGGDVTLSCRNEITSSSSPAADFYRDGLLIGRSSTGQMIIHNVSKSDGGLYMCIIPGAEESPDSWLTVRAVPDAPDAPDAPAAPLISTSRLICHSIVATPYLLCTIILMLIYRDKKRAHRLDAIDRRHDVIMEVDDVKTMYRYR